MKLSMDLVEEACKELYIRALKVLPDDIKEGINRLDRAETDGRAQVVLKTMITNICETMEMEKSEVCDLLCAAIEKKCNEATDEESDEEGINDND